MRAQSLVRRHTVWLVGAFLFMELLALALFVGLAMRPLAQRAAADLAGLMVLSAQTWAEIPPETRPAFEAALRSQYHLRLAPGRLPVSEEAWHPPFFYLLEAALAERLGEANHMVRQTADDGQAWYWVNLPAGTHALNVGLSEERISSQPLLAVSVALLVGTLLAAVLAWLLVHQLAKPLHRLADATEKLGEGGVPEPLPEEGPAEVARLSRRFNLMATRVRELLAARTLLLAGVSHDLRTPLARMRLALELLKEHPSEALVERMDRDICAMDALIANVLDLSRGLGPEPVQRVAWRPMLDELMQTRTERGCAVGLKLGLAGAAGWPTHWVVAPVALQRALDNLLDNACRHGQGHPVELAVEATAAGGWRLEVNDRGNGIPAADTEAMFEPFRRADASRHAATGGFGLGLAIVRELARAQGWQVGLLARPGGGTTAWLELPPGNG